MSKEQKAFEETAHLAPFIMQTNTFGEKHFYNITRGWCDKVSSTVIYDKYFDETLFKGDTLFVILGTDSGLLPHYLTQHKIPNGTRYLFIEPDFVLETLSANKMLDDLHPSIKIASQHDFIEEAEALKIQEYLYISSVQLIQSISCQQATLDEYATLEWSVQEWLDDARWKSQTTLLGNQNFIARQLENTADNLIPANTLKNQFEGCTVIILAGGPSLHDALPWVKKHRHQLIVFGVARISKQLLDADINPDFVFAVDPYEISFNMCCDAFYFKKPPILVHSNHVFPKLLSQWQGQSLFLSKRFPWDSDLNCENEPGAGPTVTNAALSVANLFGFKTILLAGVDLCFTKLGITHSKGSAEEQAGPKYNTTSLQVLTYNEEYHPTSIDFHTALKNLSTQAKAIGQNGKHIINLSPEAAQADGITHMPMEQIQFEKEPTIALENAKNCIQEYAVQNETHQLPTKISHELKQAGYQIRKISKLCEDALKINHKLFIDNKLADKALKKDLDKIERKLNTEYKKYSYLIKAFSIHGLIQITTPYDDERELDAERTQKLGAIYYEAYRNGADCLAQILKHAITRAACRIDESAKKPDFDNLLQQWQSDGSYKRAEYFKAHHPNTHVPVWVEKEFEKLNQSFKEQCQSAKQKNTHRIESKLAQIHAVPVKAKLLFQHKKSEELSYLLTSLKNDTKNNSHKDHIALIEAYLSELNNDINTALSGYDFIVNYEHSPLLEEALNRITAISIAQQDYSNASLALQCLSQISPMNLPHYAEAARLSGDMLAAIDAYNQYIETFPNDVEAQLKLARLYAEQNIPEGAQIMLDNILNKYPEMKAALKLKEALNLSKQHS